MKILGITAEYNPFHNGHKYHLEKSLEMTGADYAVAVMSGNFTQRGEAAFMDKWERSRLAVENGVDLVVELPFVFACGRAESFARGAVDILTELRATHISFGSESGDLERLQLLAEKMVSFEVQITEKCSIFMRQGNSFAKGNQLAVEEVLGKEAASMLLEPNNILALEYLKRVLFWKNRGRIIEPVAVKRHGSGYFDGNEAAGFAGASYIRERICELEGRHEEDRSRVDAASRIWRYVPENVAEALTVMMSGSKTKERTRNSGDAAVLTEEEFFQLARALIVRSSADELAEIYCMGEGLENRFKKEIVKAKDLSEFLSAMVSRRYTEAAIRRLLVYILVGLREKEPPAGLYARVLAAGEKGRALLKTIKKQECSSIPVITNINKETDLSEEIGATLHYDILASDMYNILCGRDLYAFSDKVIMPYIE